MTKVKKSKQVEKPQSHNPDISALAQFQPSSKNSDLVSKIGKLKIKSFGLWNPEEEFQEFDEQKPTHPYDKIILAGKRPTWEMENILPDFDPDDMDCPIGEGVDLYDSGDANGAIRHMKGLIKKDSRCIDAYAHLGNWCFEDGDLQSLENALNYYKIGAAIGLKSIGKKSNDVFPWGLIDNRPFFRCLHGLGLCFYRMKKPTEALMIFSKMIWMNPSDNQGARFLINALIDGISWEKFSDN